MRFWPRQANSRSAQPSLRRTLAMLVAASTLPGALAAGYFVLASYRDTRERAIESAAATVRALRAALDRDFSNIQAGLYVLATSEALDHDDLGVFHAHARAALPFQDVTNYVLIDPQGRQRVNTARPAGAPLPVQGAPPEMNRMFERGEPMVTNLFIGPVLGRPIFSVAVPVRRGGRTIYALGAGILPQRIAATLREQRLPPDWIAGVVDANGVLVARNRDMERHVGRPAMPAFRAAMQRQAEGTLELVSLDGQQVICAYTRSRLAPWTVAVAVPKAQLTAGLKTSLALLTAWMGLLLGVAVWSAWRLARIKVLHPIQRLLDDMHLVSSGGTLPEEPMRHTSREFARLQRGFASMSRRLQAREHEREAMLRRLTDTLESISDGFVLLDDVGCFAYANGRAQTLLRRDRLALLGNHWRTVLPPDEQARVEQPFEAARRSGQPSHFEAELPSLGAWLEIDACPSDHGLAVYFRDISELRAAREEREARAAAEAANRAKTEFLSRMSHELRTPLNGVLGFAQVLLMPGAAALSDQQREMVRQIEVSGRHLLAMISDVLDVARIEAGTMPIRLEDVDVHEAALDSLRMVRAEADAAGMPLLHELASGLGSVRADRTRLRQVLLNLLSNAIKYNRPGGTVLLRATREAGVVRFAVRDDGAGLNERQLEQLFEPFNRLGREFGTVPGTGIGLVISRWLVRMMGGEMAVHSREGEGSEFSFTLPTHDSGSAAAASTDQDGVSGAASPPTLAHGEPARLQ